MREKIGKRRGRDEGKEKERERDEHEAELHSLSSPWLGRVPRLVPVPICVCVCVCVCVEILFRRFLVWLCVCDRLKKSKMKRLLIGCCSAISPSSLNSSKTADS